MPKNQPLSYTLRIDLVNSKPPIWRRIGVDSQITLGMLHEVIQAAFGWTDSHLHAFQIGSDEFGDPDHDSTGDLEFIDERKVRLDQLVGPGDKFTYCYDFGDDWEHRIKVEKSEPMETAPLSHAWLITGKRACPPEDVGGIWGYEEFLDTISNPKTAEAQEMLEWAGGEFDPERFDLEETQMAVQEASKRRRGRK